MGVSEVKSSKTAGEILGTILIVCLLVVGALLLGSFILLVVWNAVVPAVFGLTPLTYPMAIALNILIGFVGNIFRQASK